MEIFFLNYDNPSWLMWFDSDDHRGVRGSHSPDAVFWMLYFKFREKYKQPLPLGI